MEHVRRNKDAGFTLVEFLVAMVILSVGLLGLLQAVTYTIEHNMETQLRDEAVRLADERISMEKSKVFDAISTGSDAKTEESVKVNLVSSFKNYSIVKQADTLANSTNTKTIQIDIIWKYKGKRFRHVVSTLVAKSVH